jgi:hypothetical protein
MNVDEILRHVEHMKSTDSWQKSNGAFIPAPLVYLNQMRWDGFEYPEVVSKVDNTLVKLEESRKAAVPPPPEILAKLRALKNQPRLH